MKLQSPLLEKYLTDPLGQDENVRAALQINPRDYYTVSVWPVPGNVTVDRPGSRTVPSAKISKSNQ